MTYPVTLARPAGRRLLVLSILGGLLGATRPAGAGPTTPPILPLQGPGVIGQLSIPVFGLALDVNGLGTYRLDGPTEPQGTTGANLGVFGQPEPLMIVEAGAGPNRFARGIAILSYEFAVVPPPEMECAFPAFGIPGPECRVDVVATAAGRVQTAGGTILASDPLPTFLVEATWTLHDDLGVELFSGGIAPTTTSQVFSDGRLFSLKANHAYRVTMRVDAQVGASTLAAHATALIDPVFTFPADVTDGYALRFSEGIGNTPAIPEPSRLALLCAGLLAVAPVRWRRPRSPVR